MTMMNKITIPESFKKIITHPDYVENNLNEYWNKNKKDVIDWITPQLVGEKTKYELYVKNNSKFFSTDLVDPKKGSGKFRSSLRIPFGYNGLPSESCKLVGFKIWSENAFEHKKYKHTGNTIVGDHFFSTTEGGAALFEVYRDSGWDLDFMLVNYIPSNIYKNIKIWVLNRGEHTKDKNGKSGISRRRGEYTLEQRTRGLHYTDRGINLPLLVTTPNNNLLV